MAAILEPQLDLGGVVALRRELHQHPELMFDTVQTAARVMKELDKLGIRYKSGLAKGNGLVAWLPATTNPDSATTIAFRADMDALPIHEETGKAHASSIAGKMHACGHDGHTAILVGVAQTLNKLAERPNNILFLFQPAEEGGAGGHELCKDGALNGSLIGKKADMIFGLHGWPELPLGVVATRFGPLLASADQYEIHIHGHGGHAAFPHKTIDPVVIASHIVVALQTIVARNTDPLDSAVVTIGKIDSGSASNIIPEHATLIGTLRTLDMKVRDAHYAQIEKIAKDIASAFGATARIEKGTAYPVTFNETRATERFFAVARETFGDAHVGVMERPVMGAEDFSFYGAEAPACFFCLGLAPSGTEYPQVHTPKFDFNDDAIEMGIRAFCALATSERPL